MKLTVEVKSLVSAIDWAAKRRDPKAAASYIALIVTPDGAASLSHQNATSYMRAPLAVTDAELDANESSKGVSLPLDVSSLVNMKAALNMSSKPVVIQHDSSTTSSVTVKTSNSRLTVPLIQAAVSAPPVLKELGSASGRELFGALSNLSKLCDSTHAEYMAAVGAVDIALSPDNNTITMMATDRWVMGEIIVPFEPTEEAKLFVKDRAHLLFPMEAANISSSRSDESVKIVFDPKSRKFGFVFDDGRVSLFSLKDGEPIPYVNIKTRSRQAVKSSARVDLNELKKAYAAVSAIAREEDDIYLTITGTTLTVHDRSKANSIELTLDQVNASSEQMTVKFRRILLAKSFSPITTSIANLRWLNHKVAFLLEPVTEDGAIVDSVFSLVSPSE